MVSRFCEQQAAIAAVLHKKCNLHYLELSPHEWHDLEDLINLLNSFKSATETLSGQKYLTLSCLAPNKAAFFDPKFKTFTHLPADTIDDISRSIQGEMVEILQ